MPLLVLAPAVMDRAHTRLERLVVMYLLLVVIPISALGATQYFSSATSWINRYAATDKLEDIATFGLDNHVRVTGTFSYISGMSTFAVFNFCLAGGLILAGLKRGGILLWVGAVLLSATLVVAPMTGSRGALYLPAGSLSLLVLHAVRQGRMNVRLVGLLIFGVIVASFAAGTRATQGWTSFAERVASTSDASSRVKDTFLGPVKRVGVAGLLGFGAGTTHQAAPLLARGSAHTSGSHPLTSRRKTGESHSNSERLDWCCISQ